MKNTPKPRNNQMSALDLIEDAAAIVSLALFLATVAVWSTIFIGA